MSNRKTVADLVARTEARRKAGLIPPRRVKSPPAVCSKLGAPTGQTRPCQGCGGKKLAVPLMGCETYGLCTVGRAVTLADGTPVRPCNSLCPGFSPRG